MIEAVDKYIDSAPEFAVPILQELRSIFHEADEDIGEDMKWNVPHFMKAGIVGSMTAFKKHARLIFWRGQLLQDRHNLLSPVGSKTDMASLDLRSVDDLPDRDVLIEYVREAVTLNEKGVRTTRSASPVAPPDIPEDLQRALDESPEALQAFTGFSPSEQREYTEWVTEAKRQKTRDDRIVTAVEWIEEGKPRNWKYMDKWRSDAE